MTRALARLLCKSVHFVNLHLVKKERVLHASVAKFFHLIGLKENKESHGLNE